MNKKLILFTVLCLAFGFVAITSGASITITNPIRANDFVDLLTNYIIPAVTVLIGSLSVIFFVWAGILYLTSAGDTGRMGKAKTALFYAIIGTAIALSASTLMTIIKEIISAKPGP